MADYRVTVGASGPADGNDAHTTTIAAAMVNVVANWAYANQDKATSQLIYLAEYNDSRISLGGLTSLISGFV